MDGKAPLRERLEAEARALGFSAFGIARADAAPKAGERLLHDWRGIDEHFQLTPCLGDQPARQRLQRLLDGVVIVAALRVDRDPRR